MLFEEEGEGKMTAIAIIPAVAHVAANPAVRIALSVLLAAERVTVRNFTRRHF